MAEFNIAPNTQIGRIEIEPGVYANENAYNIEPEKYSRGGEFIENLVTDNIIEYCHRWFHLANIEEFIDDIDDFYSKRELGKFSNLVEAGFVDNTGFSPIFPTSGAIQKPVRFNQPKVTSPVTFYNKRNPDYNYDKLYSLKENN